MRRVLLFFVIALGAITTDCAARELIRGRYADFYLDNPARFNAMDSTVTRARNRLAYLLEDTLSYRPQIHVVTDRQLFDSLIGGAFPDWGAAAAVPHRELIVIKSPDQFNINRSLEELLAHEFAHLAVDHRVGWNRAPRWFNEGMAMMVSSEWDWSDNVTLSRAVLFGQLLDLYEIEKVNRFQAGKAHTAYTQSYAAVKYLFDAYRVNAVNIFLDSVQAGSSLDAALMASTGSDYRDFNRELNEHLRTTYNIAAIFIDNMYFWLILALIVIIGGILAIVRRRKYYQKWEEEEKYQSTDFDYGDPDNPEVSDDDEPWRQ